VNGYKLFTGQSAQMPESMREEGLGNLAFYDRHLQEAANHYERRLRLEKVKDYEGAAQCYRDAVRIDPKDPTNLYNLKAVLGQLAPSFIHSRS
jgi:tetratricopeptide (TPR) repeat protein